MRQWNGLALVQIMACRLCGTKPSSKPIVNCTLTDKLHWNFNQNQNLFIHKNASENILCEMAAILSTGRWVNICIFHQCGGLVSSISHKTHMFTHLLLGIWMPLWGQDKMATIFQTTYSNAFSWMKIYEFWFKCHWSLLPRVQLIIFQHWF